MDVAPDDLVAGVLVPVDRDGGDALLSPLLDLHDHVDDPSGGVRVELGGLDARVEVRALVVLLLDAVAALRLDLAGVDLAGDEA